MATSFSLNRYFQLTQRRTTMTRELRGAVATFLTMAYILFVNPSILSAAGVPHDSAVACTALAAGICCLLMGFYANLPIATASGMGLNAFVAFTIAKSAGSWQAAMGVIVLDGTSRAGKTSLVRTAFSDALWGFCELAIMACDLAEVLGSAVALNLLFHIPLQVAGHPGLEGEHGGSDGVHRRAVEGTARCRAARGGGSGEK